MSISTASKDAETRRETKPRNLRGRKRAEADAKCIEDLFNEVTARNSQNLGIQKQEALRAPSGDDQKSPFPGCVIVQMSTMQIKEAILKAVGGKLTKANIRITSNFLSAP